MTIEERVKYAVDTMVGMDRDSLERVFRAHFLAVAEEERIRAARIINDVYLAWVEGDYSPGEAFESAREKIHYGGERCNKSDGGTK